MSNGNGHRWSKFWWADWENDPELRLCALASQAVWMRILCVMHRSEHRGSFVVAGKAPTDKQAAAILGLPLKEVAAALADLEANRVLNRVLNGVIVCPRMVRDTAASDAGRQHISKRWGQQNTTHPIRDPNRGNGEDPNRDPNSQIREEEKREDPPRNPPQGGTARRADRKPVFRNGFRALATQGPPLVVIDGTAQETEAFHAFHGELRRAIDGR